MSIALFIFVFLVGCIYYFVQGFSCWNKALILQFAQELREQIMGLHSEELQLLTNRHTAALEAKEQEMRTLNEQHTAVLTKKDETIEELRLQIASMERNDFDSNDDTLVLDDHHHNHEFPAENDEVPPRRRRIQPDYLRY